MLFSEPAVSVGATDEGIWIDLVARFVDPMETAATRPLTASQERHSVLQDFVDRCRAVPTLRHAVSRSVTVKGAHLPHRLDVTLQNGRLVAVAQAIPLAVG